MKNNIDEKIVEYNLEYTPIFRNPIHITTRSSQTEVAKISCGPVNRKKVLVVTIEPKNDTYSDKKQTFNFQKTIFKWIFPRGTFKLSGKNISAESITVSYELKSMENIKSINIRLNKE